MMGKELSSNLIKEIIKSAIIRNVRKEYPLEKTKIFVTEITGCIRQSFYNRIFLNNLSYKAAFRILRGILLHEWLAEKLPIGLSEVRDRNYLKMEMEIKDGIKLLGRADYLMGNCVVELKTTSKKKIDKPLEEHVNQVLMYMYMLKKDKGVIVYLHDNGEISSFTINRDEGKIKKLIEKAKDLYKALKSGYAPKAEPGYYCKWCPWNTRDFCKEGLTNR